MNTNEKKIVSILSKFIIYNLIYSHSKLPTIGVSSKWLFVAESPDSAFSFFIWRGHLPDSERETETTLGFLYNNDRAADSIALIVRLDIIKMNSE